MTMVRLDKGDGLGKRAYADAFKTSLLEWLVKQRRGKSFSRRSSHKSCCAYRRTNVLSQSSIGASFSKSAMEQKAMFETFSNGAIHWFLYFQITQYKTRILYLLGFL